MSDPMKPDAPAGWCEDPLLPGQQRRWDGRGWNTDIRSAPPTLGAVVEEAVTPRGGALLIRSLFTAISGANGSTTREDGIQVFSSTCQCSDAAFAGELKTAARNAMRATARSSRRLAARGSVRSWWASLSR